ncbi:MAG: (Na+)-NQR maturation NqrM [Planctomycetota bacterium]|nr:(Na+)-NQR maturation NqrM [Planctomycetota bacterium]
MTTLLLTIALIAILMTGMAVGVIFANKELKGSCGGVGNCECEEAGRPPECQKPEKASEFNSQTSFSV